LSPKKGSLGRCPGPGKDDQNNAKTHLHVTFPPEKLKPKTKNFFFDFDYKTCWIRRGFEQLSSSSGWRFMAKKVRADIWSRMVIKGCQCKLLLCYQKCFHWSKIFFN